MNMKNLMKVRVHSEYGISVPDFFPMELLNENRAISNHSQSLKVLNERGGMGILEILDNIYDRKLTRREETQEDVIELNKIYLKYLKPKPPEVVRLPFDSKFKDGRTVIYTSDWNEFGELVWTEHIITPERIKEIIEGLNKTLSEYSKSNFVQDVFCDCGDQMTVGEVKNDKCNNCGRSLNL